jgi:shikimate kinase
MVRTIAIGGFMGVGKTTAGRCLAKRLALPFVDLDEAIEHDVGTSIATIFKNEGEANFRRLERASLQAVLSGGPVVLALGGGTLHYPNNLEELRAKSDLVCLEMPFSEIQERIGDSNGKRPLWEDRERLFEERLAGYRHAGPCINVSGLSTHQVVDSIQRVLPCR